MYSIRTLNSAVLVYSLINIKMSQEHLKGSSSGVSSFHGVVGQRVGGLVEIQPNSECSQEFINKEKPPSYEEAVQNKYIGGPSVSTNVPYNSSQLNAVEVQPFSTSKPYETQANKYIGGPSVSTNVPYTSSQLNAFEVQPLSTSKPYETQPNVVIHKHYYHQTEPSYSTNPEPTATSQALACLNCFNCFISCMEIVLLCVQCFKS